MLHDRGTRDSHAVKPPDLYIALTNFYLSLLGRVHSLHDIRSILSSRVSSLDFSLVRSRQRAVFAAIGGHVKAHLTVTLASSAENFPIPPAGTEDPGEMKTLTYSTCCAVKPHSV